MSNDNDTPNINLENHGKIWETEHDTRLTYLFQQDYSIPFICEQLGRTPYAIVQRLFDLKEIYFNKHENAYKVMPRTFINVRDLQQINNTYK